MPLPASQELAAYQGDSYVLKCQYQDAEGTPLDLTGAAVRLAAKAAINDPDPVMILAGQLYNPPKGKFAFAITPTASKRLPLSMVYDVQITFRDGFVRTIMRGNFTLIPEVY